MPKNKVSDPITDQEIAFAHLLLAGTMTDRQAAEAVGLNPDTAAYTKSKPRVRDYMLEHRAAVQQQLVEQEAEGLRRLNVGREQVLARLWEIANLSPEMTRGSASSQVKALAMIVAIEGLIPDRRAGSSSPQPASPKESAPPPTAKFYTAAWLRKQQGKTTVPQPSPDLVPDEDPPSVPDPTPGAPADAPSGPGPNPGPGPAFESSEFGFGHPVSPVETTPMSPYARVPDSAPYTRVPFSIPRNPFTRRR